ncbi:ABC transporter substrate-binding protein [Luteipulveratus sp. YIM 133132]|uniref:ABC transporter substrate-binding protein n=1 Tax=Luteipulveratus flavus TaxID=3031728 RepID=UPI0023B02022|nr:ABC transporter substrate-binding protein [Luteipulveratus sp. YIM 133132]MDE9364655.1 ABC transporter substrate-binding protein [Luteipulveratus sp. YIM 133132]
MKRTLMALAAVVTLTVTGCGGGDDNPLQSGTGGGAGGGSASSGAGGGSAPAGAIKVGAADFPESQLLAQLYAGALKAKGVNASATDPIGAREAYLTALKDGSIQVMPEYTGSLLTYLDKSATAKDPDQVYAALKTKLPANQVVLDKSAAEDKNSMVVSKKTADKYQLKSIADLAKHQNDITVAAPPEFKGREQGLVGLKSAYGFTPKSFRPLKSSAVVQALKNGQADAANIFSTDPAIAENNFVVLDDPKKLFGSDNIVPLVAKANESQVSAALNAVQAKLTTQNLSEMLKQVTVDKKDPDKVAQDFLKQQGLA